MATPTLRALRRQVGPEGELIGVLRPYVREVLQGTDWLDGTLEYDPASRHRHHQCLSVARRLRRRRVETVMLLSNSFRAAAVAWLSGAHNRVGYCRNGRGCLLSRRLRPPRRGWRLVPVSAVDYYLEIAQALGVPSAGRHMELATTPADEQRADAAWERWGWDRCETVVSLNNGGAYGAAKWWPAESFVQLARKIACDFAVKVLILCGPAERDASRVMAAQAGHPAVRSLAEFQPSIGLTKACLRRSHLLVTTDSGPRHLATALGTATVSLFGPTDPRWSANYARQGLKLWHPVPCGPCGRRECPLGHHDCMRGLPVDRVYRATARLLEERYVTRTVPQPTSGHRSSKTAVPPT
jgi:heptosyltransferase-2